MSKVLGLYDPLVTDKEFPPLPSSMKKGVPVNASFGSFDLSSRIFVPSPFFVLVPSSESEHSCFIC